MFRYICIFFFIGHSLWAQSPEALHLHLHLDEVKQQLFLRTEIIGAPKGKWKLSINKNLRLLDQQAYRQNLPVTAQLNKASNSIELEWGSEVSQWVLKWTMPIELLSSRLRNGGLHFGEDFPWPINWPGTWKMPIYFSLELSDPNLAFSETLKADLIVDDSDGRRIWFFAPSMATKPNEFHFRVGEDIAPTIPIAAVNIEIQEEGYEEIPMPISPAQSASVEVKNTYAKELESFWQEQLDLDCNNLLSDSLQLVGKARDQNLLDIEEKLFTAEIGPIAFLHQLKHWRFHQLQSWINAIDGTQNMQGSRELQFVFNRRSAYSKVLDVIDPLGDTNTLDVRLKRWYLSQLDSIKKENFKCELLAKHDFVLAKTDKLSDLWNKLISQNNLAQIKLTYRHDRKNGLLYIYTHQDQKETVSADVNLVVFTSNNEQRLFQLNLRGRRDTFKFKLQESLSYLSLDPEMKWPIWWQIEMSDLQLFMQFKASETRTERYEAMSALMQVKNPNLKRTALNIALRDEWSELRAMAVLSAAEIPESDWQWLAEDVKRLSEEDPDPRVQAYASDLLLERPISE